tara:strand:- start:440 stop:970 length:531 start_codon:yes stop_codon:yes gene_type:complete
MKSQQMYKIYDQVPLTVRQKTYDFVCNSTFKLGWQDRNEPEKLHFNIYSEWNKKNLHDCGLLQHLNEVCALNNLDPNNLQRSIVNLTKCGDFNFCHTHQNKKVLLYYVNLEWKDGFGGETIFYEDNLKDAIAVSSFVSGRIILFDGSIPHTIRSQSTYAPSYRFTISNFLHEEKGS